MASAETLQNVYEPRPNPQSLTSNSSPSNNSSSGVDYEPHPEDSIQIPLDRERIVKRITNLYSGSASEEDMQVYAPEAVYDDPWSYCDTRYKIAGQWYGMWAQFLSCKVAKVDAQLRIQKKVVSRRARFRSLHSSHHMMSPNKI